jgi:hypothetical protein
MDMCNFNEPATCKDDYVPVNSEEKDGSCMYRCYKSGAAYLYRLSAAATAAIPAANGERDNTKCNSYSSELLTEWQHIKNSAIVGHNTQVVSGSVQVCKKACESYAWCNSFDYSKAGVSCDLSNAPISTSLKTNYVGDPYDHYRLGAENSAENITKYEITTNTVGLLLFPKTTTIVMEASKNMVQKDVVRKTIKIDVPRPPKPIFKMSKEMNFAANGAVTFTSNSEITSRIMTPTKRLDGIAFSFSAWVKLSNHSSLKQQSIFDLGSNPLSENVILSFDATSTRMNYQIYYNWGTSKQIHFNDIQTTDTFPKSSWTLVQLIHRTDNTVSLYWDGVEKASGSTPMPLVSKTRTWYLGKSHSLNHIDFQGFMKEIVFFKRRVYEKALHELAPLLFPEYKKRVEGSEKAKVVAS